MKHTHLHILPVLSALSLLPSVFGLSQVQAASFTWQGSAGNGSWSNAANWVGSAVPANDGTADLFFGATSFAANSTIQPNYSIRSLTWNAGASAYNYGGSALTLGAGGLNQNAANAQVFGAAISLGTNQAWTLANGAGALTFNNGVKLASFALTVNAATTTGTGNVLTGDLSGSGSLTKTGAGILTLSGKASNYTGDTTVNAGTLAISNDTSLGTGNVNLNGGELRATANVTLKNALNLGSGNNPAGTVSAAANTTLTVTNLVLSGDLTVGAAGQTGTVVFAPTGYGTSSNATLTVNDGTLRLGSADAALVPGLIASTTVSTGGTLDLNGFSTSLTSLGGTGAITTGGTAATVLTVSAGSFAGGVSGLGALTKTSADTLTLSGVNTYQGATTVNAGILAIIGSVNSGTGTVLKVDGTGGSLATLNLSGSGSSLSTGFAFIGNNAPGVFNQSGGTFTTNGRELYLGYNTGSSGTYTLTGGSLSTGTAFVGRNGAGTFIQSGGTFTTNGATLYVGYNRSGNGTYNLTGGSLVTSSTTLSNNTSTFTQSGGTHTTGALLLSDIFSDANVSYNLDGGTLALNNVIRVTGTGVFNFNGGTLQARQNATAFFTGLTTANVRSGGAVINTAGFNVNVAQNLLHSTLPGDDATDGGLTKNGAGTLTLTGANTFTGALTINAGTLAVAAESALGAPNGGTVTVGGGGQLLFTSTALARNYNLGVSTLAVGGGNTLTFGNGATVSGGFLSGPGTFALGDGATLGGVTLLANSTLTQAAGSAATLNTATVRGTLTQTGGTLNINNGLVLGSGRLSVGGTVNTTGTEIQGATTINNGGTVANSGGSLYLTSGSRTTVNSGGTLSTASLTSIELNGGLLVNNGRQTGVLDINFGSLAKGSGSFGTINVADGGKFSPGNSPGTATVGSLSFNAAGRYDFELNSANATAGAGADFISVGGVLALNAGLTANSRFTVAIISLDGSNNAAALADFDASRSYTFVLASAAGGITGFNAGEFTVDTSGFLNSLNGGSFSVSQNGNDLDLNFTPSAVPEPASWALLGIGCLGLFGAARYRRPRA